MVGPTVGNGPAAPPSVPVPGPTDRVWRTGRDLVLHGALAGAVYVGGYLARAAGLSEGRLRWSGAVAALLVAAGWALASRGRLGVAWVADVRRDLTATARSAVVASAVWAGVLALGVTGPGTGREALPLLAGGATAVVVLLYRRPPLRVLGARGLVSVLLALHVAGFAWAGIEKVEAYPYAPFQMYSVPRTSPYEVTVPRLEAVTGAGEVVDLTGQAGGATLRAWLADPSAERVETTVRDIAEAHEARTGTSLVEVRVLEERWTVPPAPAPPRAVLAETEVVRRVVP